MLRLLNDPEINTLFQDVYVTFSQTHKHSSVIVFSNLKKSVQLLIATFVFTNKKNFVHFI